MSSLHDLCRLSQRPIGDDYVESLKSLLKAGIPATYTIEEALRYTKETEENDEHDENENEIESSSTTTPLHMLFTHLPEDISSEEMEYVSKMVTILLEYGAGWCLVDVNSETPGCILHRKGFNDSILYKQIVDAGVRAELLLRKVNEFDVEFLSDNEEEGGVVGADNATSEISDLSQTSGTTGISDLSNNISQPKDQEENTPTTSTLVGSKAESQDKNDPSFNQDAYLKTELEYKNGSLLTKDNQDGVMMEWERDLMKLGCDSLFKGSGEESGEVDPEINILNIGFGMGIIDEMISAKNPTKHYICEAHPQVLKKLKDDGWYEKPNVVILEGRWQDQLHKLLSAGDVYFNGIYYDTFSEHYSDILELLDYVVGLMKPQGVFSFFNGLGADRPVVYDVYRNLVQIDFQNYGLACQFTDVKVPEETMKKGDASVWDDIRKAYWSCPIFYHPEARFVDF